MFEHWDPSTTIRLTRDETRWFATKHWDRGQSCGQNDSKREAMGPRNIVIRPHHILNRVFFISKLFSCPRSSYPIYRVSYYIRWVNTSWTYCTKSKKQKELQSNIHLFPSNVPEVRIFQNSTTTVYCGKIGFCGLLAVCPKSLVHFYIIGWY